jgi:hypothetical protein
MLIIEIIRARMLSICASKSDWPIRAGWPVYFLSSKNTSGRAYPAALGMKPAAQFFLRRAMTSPGDRDYVLLVDEAAERRVRALERPRDGGRETASHESLLASDWYRVRLCSKQARDLALWKRHLAALEGFEASGIEAARIDIAGRLAHAREQLARVSNSDYLDELRGTIGADPCVDRGC